MIQLSLVWVTILGEVVLVLVISLASVLFLNAKRRRQDRQAAMYLVGVIKEGEAQRLEETRDLLQQRFGLHDDALGSTAHAMLRAEKLLYQRFINLYIRRNRAALRGLNIDVEAVTEPFRELEVAAPASAPAPAADAGPEGGDDDRLAVENEALKQELQITMETMSRMLGEYAAMFGGGPQLQSSGMQAMLEQGDEAETDLTADVPGAVGEEDFGTDLEELEDLVADDRTQLLDSSASPEPEGAEVDLSAEAFDEALAAEDEGGQAMEEAGESMDDELADVWAEALAEQEQSEKDK